MTRESRKKEAMRWVKIYTPLFILSLCFGRLTGNRETPVNGVMGYYEALAILTGCFYGFCVLYVWGLTAVSVFRSKFFKKELIDG